jgi:hypothetical protein
MTTSEWLTTIDQAAEVGVGLIQFIGGEPTLHRDLGVMIESVLAHGVAVEVYSNLLHVPDRVWELLQRPGVRLATSYHSEVRTVVRSSDQRERPTGNTPGRVRSGLTAIPTPRLPAGPKTESKGPCAPDDPPRRNGEPNGRAPVRRDGLAPSNAMWRAYAGAVGDRFA